MGDDGEIVCNAPLQRRDRILRNSTTEVFATAGMAAKISAA